MANTSALFRNRVVQAILVSGVFMQIGIWVRNFAVLLYIVERTNNDPFALSMIYMAEFAPMFVFSFIGGTFADRWRPKQTMIWCDLLSALSVLAVLLAFLSGTWKAVFFATLVSAILSQFSQPSGLKLLKTHLPESQLQAAISLYQTLFALFMVAGPVMGTFVYQHFGIEVSMALTVAAFLLTAATLAFIPSDRAENEGKQAGSLQREMIEGVRYVLASKPLTLLGVCFLAAGLGLGLIQPLTVLLVTDRLGLPKESLQWLLTANGAGMIAGGAMAMAFARTLLPQKLLMIGMLVNALGISLSGLSGQVWLTLAAQFAGGLFLPSIHIGANTLILQNTETAFVGRVNGILTPLFSGAMLVTMSLTAPLKEWFSLVGMYQIAALLFIAGLLSIIPLLRLPAGQRTRTASESPE